MVKSTGKPKRRPGFFCCIDHSKEKLGDSFPFDGEPQSRWPSFARTVSAWSRSLAVTMGTMGTMGTQVILILDITRSTASGSR